MTDPDLTDLAMQVVLETSAVPVRSDSPDAATAEKPIRPPPLPIKPESSRLIPAAPTKEMRTADELAGMILADLSQIEACPKRGMKVTVYGSNPWNSWLSFGGDAGPGTRSVAASSARRMVVTKSGVKAMVTCGILGSLGFALAA